MLLTSRLCGSQGGFKGNQGAGSNRWRVYLCVHVHNEAVKKVFQHGALAALNVLICQGQCGQKVIFCYDTKSTR